MKDVHIRVAGSEENYPIYYRIVFVKLVLLYSCFAHMAENTMSC